MNKDQVRGTFKNYVGKVQEEVGKLVGSRHQQIKGIQKQVTGKAEKRIGDVKHVLRETATMAKNALSNR